MISMHCIYCAPEHGHSDTSPLTRHGVAAPRHARAARKHGGIRVRLRKVGSVRPLTRQEEADLIGLVKKGDKKACETVIKANIRLVAGIAVHYASFGQPLLDLINEGNIALLRAVERFDPAEDGKLSAYASPWIKQRIERSLAVRPSSSRARSARPLNKPAVA
ncbi:MAG: hypothetical protein HZC54_02255 [Verrucomicrobia bacterium]|nr:hypothetical protein [Verrucomicrobiota bacterium]